MEPKPGQGSWGVFGFVFVLFCVFCHLLMSSAFKNQKYGEEAKHRRLLFPIPFPFLIKEGAVPMRTCSQEC